MKSEPKLLLKSQRVNNTSRFVYTLNKIFCVFLCISFELVFDICCYLVEAPEFSFFQIGFIGSYNDPEVVIKGAGKYDDRDNCRRIAVTKLSDSAGQSVCGFLYTHMLRIEGYKMHRPVRGAWCNTAE